MLRSSFAYTYYTVGKTTVTSNYERFARVFQTPYTYVTITICAHGKRSERLYAVLWENNRPVLLQRLRSLHTYLRERPQSIN